MSDILQSFNEWLKGLPRWQYWSVLILTGAIAYNLGDILIWIF